MIEDVEGYLLLALKACDELYDDKELNPSQDNPSERIAEIETVINSAIDKTTKLKG